MTPPRLFAVLMLLVALISSSCSTFQRDWSDAALTPAGSGSTATIEGRWDGSWKSDTNRHYGKLRCIVSPTDRPGHYKFRYWGTFAKIFRFHYKVEYDAEHHDGAWQMAGESDLGIMGGKFHHTATIDGDKFDATYSSKWDNGKFNLHRPAE
jgi:hypothetical protein